MRNYFLFAKKTITKENLKSSLNIYPKHSLKDEKTDSRNNKNLNNN